MRLSERSIAHVSPLSPMEVRELGPLGVGEVLDVAIKICRHREEPADRQGFAWREIPHIANTNTHSVRF